MSRAVVAFHMGSWDDERPVPPEIVAAVKAVYDLLYPNGVAPGTCACGCGQPVNPGATFVNGGHSMRLKHRVAPERH